MNIDFASVDLSLVITSLLGLFGLLIILYDRRMRARILKDDRRSRIELQSQELALRRDQFDEEKRERKERIEWLQRESIRLNEIGEPLAKSIASQLASNEQWAVEALEKTKLGPHAATLFGERRGHFRPERGHMENLQSKSGFASTASDTLFQRRLVATSRDARQSILR